MIVLTCVATAYAAFELADVASACQLLAAAEALLPNLGHDVLTWRVTALRLAVTMYQGQLDRSEELLGTLSSLDQAVGSAATMLVGRGVLQLRFEQDRLDELLPLLDKMVGGPPVAGWRSARALALARAGRTDEAHHELTQITAEIEVAGRHVGWLTHRCADALTAHAVGHTTAAQVLSDCLGPTKADCASTSSHQLARSASRWAWPGR